MANTEELNEVLFGDRIKINVKLVPYGCIVCR